MTERYEVPAAGTPGATFTVEGPVLAEILVVALMSDRILLSGPCGPAPWLVEVDGDPMQVVATLVRRNLGEPLVAHSTSWRRDRDAVVLTFVAVVTPGDIVGFETSPIERADLARGEAAAAPEAIESSAVIEHGLRHLAWLVRDDAVVAERLGPAWAATLDGYVPEPFRALAGG